MTTLNVDNAFAVDENKRKRMRSLRVSTFGDIFFKLATEDTYADALPEDVFLAAVDEAFEQRRQRNIGKAIDRAGFRYPDATLAEIIRPQERGINMRQLKRLAATNWRETPPTCTSSHPQAPVKPTSPAQSG